MKDTASEMRCPWHLWRPDELAFIALVFFASIGAWTLPDQRVVAMTTTLGIVVALLCIDWHGVVTLRGVINWGSIAYSALTLFAFLMVALFPLTLALYLLIALADYRVACHDAARVRLKRAFAQRVIDIATLHRSDSKKSA